MATAAFAEPLQWKLASSDFVRFDRRPVTFRAGKETFGDPNFVTVYGHQLVDGQFEPVSPARSDLPAYFAFRLPGDGKPFRLHLRQTVEIKVRGEVAVEGDHLVGRFRFESRGKPDRSDKHEIRGGQVTTKMTFDKELGAFTGGRVDLRYTLRKLKPKSGDKPKESVKEYEFKRIAIERGSGKDLRGQVNKAIDKGVEKLTELQIQDKHGRWKPHGKYNVGTTALVILTLAACDVPRDDKRVKGPLDWLFRQTPKKTYDLAVALMAVDRAFTPKSEIEAAHRGRRVAFKRALTKTQRAWCHRVARNLETTASGPGTWGYPPGGRHLVRADTSNSQYAVLGLRAAAHLGYTAKEQTWLGVIRHYQQHRAKDGERGEVILLREGQALAEARAYKVRNTSGFRYTTRRTSGWASMACAAITSLSVARDELLRQKSARFNKSRAAEID